MWRGRREAGCRSRISPATLRRLATESGFDVLSLSTSVRLAAGIFLESGRIARREEGSDRSTSLLRARASIEPVLQRMAAVGDRWAGDELILIARPAGV